MIYCTVSLVEVDIDPSASTRNHRQKKGEGAFAPKSLYVIMSPITVGNVLT